MLRFPIFSKVLMISLLALALLIPLAMIDAKISERQSQQRNVQSEIAQNAAGAQTIAGPYLVIDYKLIERTLVKDEKGRESTRISESAPMHAVFAPHAVNIDGHADVEIRHRGIYQARLFNLHSKIKGDFVIPSGYGLSQPIEDIIPQGAHVVLNLSDARGIRNNPVLTLNAVKHEFESGSTEPLKGNGIHATLQPLDKSGEQHLSFELPLDLQGMATLAVAPVANDTQMTLRSTWPHPSFNGRFLPRTHEMNQSGFNAYWQIPRMALNTARDDNAPFQAETFSIDFIDPVNIYLMSERAVKYGVMFVVLIFTAFFLFEVMNKLRIHPMQYLLVGLAMAMFFLLIISLSEHMAFLPAYAISGMACAVLIGTYLAGALRNHKAAFGFASGIALLYALLYGVLQSEDNALLMGTLILFVALGSVMLLTRKMDWYGFAKDQGTP